MKKRSLLVAYGQGNFVISNPEGTGLLEDCFIPPDLRNFAKITKKAKVVIMGRKNYESLPKDYQPLPDRINIVITRNPLWVPKHPEDENVIVVHSLWEALEEAEKLPGDEIAIIGGEEIYRLALENITIHELHLTCVMGKFEGKAIFPMNLLDLNDYEIVEDQEFLKNEKNTHSFSIRSYKKRA